MNIAGKKVAYITLGCKLNFSETSTIRHSLEKEGTETVADKEGADIFVINTCSVTDMAEKKGRGSRYMYNNSTQKNLPSNNRTLTNEIYSYLGIAGMLGKKFNYSVSAGVNGNIFTTIENKEYKFVYFRPQVKLGYFIDESSDLTFNYEVNTENPAISSLTYNPYFKDANYLYVGNPNLKPSNNHDLSLSYFKGFKKFVISAEVAYSYNKDAIAPRRT